MIWFGMVWYGLVWFGMVWYGLVWSDLLASDPLNRYLSIAVGNAFVVRIQINRPGDLV
jgi:hypothetical protein